MWLRVAGAGGMPLHPRGQRPTGHRCENAPPHSWEPAPGLHCRRKQNGSCRPPPRRNEMEYGMGNREGAASDIPALDGFQPVARVPAGLDRPGPCAIRRAPRVAVVDLCMNVDKMTLRVQE